MARRSWGQRLARYAVLRAAKYAGIPLRDPALVQMLGSQPAASGVDVDEGTALNYSAVWAAVNIIASNIAAMPVSPYRMKKDGHRVEATDTPQWRMMRVAPNDEMTPYVFHETLTAHAVTWGNAYARLDKESEDAPATEARPLMPNQVTPMRRPDTGEVYYKFKAVYEGEEDDELESWEVLHVPGLAFDGIKGYDVISQAREAIGLGMAAEKFGAAFFGRGCTLGGIITYPEELEMTEKAKCNLRESFELLHRGPDNSHRIAILEQGMEYKQLGIPPEAAQFLETRKFQVVEIARWFGIPPHLLRDLDRATFSNIEHQGIDFLQYCLRPWMLRWAQEYQRKVFGPYDQTDYIVCHDTHNLLMTDIAARYNAYNVGRNGGWLTLNDIMRREGMNPLPPAVGDTRLAPSTMKVLDRPDPVDPDVLRKTVDLIQSAPQRDPALVKAILCAAVPQATEDFVSTLTEAIMRGGFDGIGEATQAG